MEKSFDKNTFSKKIKSMLMVDARRVLTSRFFYIMLAIAIVLPVVILVMTSFMEGTENVNPQTGEVTIMEGFDSVWQMLGALPESEEKTTETAHAAGGMDLVSMCNINLMFFISAVFVCVFVCDDFRSGYTKNLFAVRASKSDYVLSKTIVCYLASAVMLVCFFIGTLIGGAVSGVSFATEGFHIGNIANCILSKIFLLAVFTSVYLIMSLLAKQRLWLSVLLSFGIGMIFFTMIPMATPLLATPIHTVICVAVGVAVSVGLGALSTLLLRKIDIL